MHSPESRRGFNDEEMAFAATMAVLVVLLLVAMLFFGTFFVEPLA